LLAVFVAGTSALLAVPRAVPPVDFPEPMIEPRELARAARADQALADAAERERLDADVRRVGSAIRAYGLAEIADAGPPELERREVAGAAQRALAQGEAALARLRAYQLRSFLRELHRWEQTGEETDELRELGGPFLDSARRSGWVEGGRRLVLDDTVRAVLFKKRWVDLTLVHGPALDLSSAESRALYRFLILHPPRDPGRGIDEGGPGATMRAAIAAEQYRLRKIEELHTLDPSYPADLGRGVALYRIHRYPQAVEAFRRHLDDHPDGPHTLRAQNYLRAALGAAMEAP
jgi:tetratricopeptide (TPR) repeat protein